ncbi:hypothetical protein SADUNF_Sadunf02G0000900 [Salix dunnii]|uniref:EF-hand domain-containing protein n=1 Tax=Salix dunnii TaxID=1413687 RepID=A0A835TEN7_9ROSI|nr:hypothetical protein SADUNF_Sadunf02G0000900 [Salix dunnii]
MKSHSVSSSPPTSANSSPLARLRRKLSPRKSHDKPPPTNVNNSSSAPNVVDDNNDLRWVFNYFDENGDGKISPAELQSCITSAGGKLSIEEAEAAIRFSDMDGDGLLGFQDFLSLMTGSVSEEEKTEDLRQAFRLYETEPGSGCITHTSLKRVLSRLGFGWNSLSFLWVSVGDASYVPADWDESFTSLNFLMGSERTGFHSDWVSSGFVNSSGAASLGFSSGLGIKKILCVFYCGYVQFCSIVAVGLEKMARITLKLIIQF